MQNKQQYSINISLFVLINVVIIEYSVYYYNAQKERIIMSNLSVRHDGRNIDEIRDIKMTTGFIETAAGSVLIESGKTRVICTATVDEKVPPFLKDKGQGWLTAEYAMLPGSTNTRKSRASSKGKVDGRSTEIQRLIGRALRSVMDFKLLGERTIWIDCDVITADGGTRTASITGSFVALALCINKLLDDGIIEKSPITQGVAAISMGIVNEIPMLDLCYIEDSNAKVDMNLVMTHDIRLIEIQGTGEESPFTIDELNELLRLAKIGVSKLADEQKNVLGDIYDRVCNGKAAE